MSRKALAWIVVTMFLATSLIIHAASPQSAASPTPSGHDPFAGVWSLNRDKSELPGRGNPPDGGGSGSGRRGGGAGGFGGRRGGGFGGRGGSGGRSPEQLQAMMNYMRTLTEASSRITIVVHDMSVGMTDAEGMTLTLQTNNKKIDERAENSLVKLTRKSRWDGSTLVSEIEIENGPKIERKYELSPAGTELHISTTMSGGFGGRGGGGNRTVTHVYERPLEQ